MIFTSDLRSAHRVLKRHCGGERGGEFDADFTLFLAAKT
jgi:hypothetical protein